MNILERVCQAMSTCYGLRDEYHVQVSTPYKSVSIMNMVKKVSLFHSTNDMNGKRWILLWASTGKYLSKE